MRELQARLLAADERLAKEETIISDLRADRDKWRRQASALLTNKRPKLSP